MEREKFEESLKKAFERAEVSPSENVWTNIELDLEKERGGELKKRLLFYKMLAAACVVFAMAVGGVGYYYTFTPNAAGSLADNRVTTPSADPLTRSENQSASDPSSPEGNTGEQILEPYTGTESGTDPGDPVSKADKSQTRSILDGRPGSGDAPANDHQIANQISPDQPYKETDPERAVKDNAVATLASGDNNLNKRASTDVKDKEISPLYTPREVRLNFQKEEPVVDPVVAMLAKLERREKEVQGREDTRKSESGGENLWTSIGFAAGSFNAMQSSSSGPAALSPSTASALAAPIVDQETKASGYSYTMGVNVGTKLSERWVFQGGVNYLTHSSEYTANNVVMESMGKYQQQRFRAATTNDLVNADEAELNNKLVYSAPYNVNNSMRYLSIPMQAGYLLINKTFGLQLNAGVATDLFLQNTVTPQSDQLAKTSQPSGSDSPYRAVNLSGLFGTEVSYRFGPHYRVSLNPGIRYPFSTIYKSELGVQSTPLTFDVGLRFRYIFH